MEEQNNCMICNREAEKGSNKCKYCNDALNHSISEKKRLFGEKWFENENYWSFIKTH